MGSKPLLNKTECITCGVILTAENCVFSGTKLRTWCRDCYKDYQRKWRMNNPKAHVAYDLKQYGITVSEYDKRVELQLGGCAICKQPCESGQRLAVDHNHSNNQIRDLLCKRCNVIIGLCKEDDGLLFDIIDYLKRHQLRKAG